jgi:hypothetical protein
VQQSNLCWQSFETGKFLKRITAQPPAHRRRDVLPSVMSIGIVIGQCGEVDIDCACVKVVWTYKLLSSYLCLPSQRLSLLSVFSSHIRRIKAFSAMYVFMIVHNPAAASAAYGGSYEARQIHIHFREDPGSVYEPHIQGLVIVTSV